MNARFPVFGLLTVFFAICVLGSKSHATDPRDIFKQISPSVVLIRTYGSDSTPLKLGSGFFLDDGHKLVTNFHVVGGASRVEIVSPDKSTAETRDVIAYSEEHDLAILYISAAGKAVPLSTRQPDVGDHILAIGNPVGLQRTLSEGLISGVREIAGQTFYQMTAPISPGSSGGPIIDDAGNAIGVASFTVLESQNINFAIPSAEVAELLKKPTPVTLDKLPQRGGSAQLVFGKGGLEVVKFAKTGNAVGISIKNTTDSAIAAVLVRVLYSEESKEVEQRRKLESAIDKLKTTMHEKERGRALTEQRLRRLNSINFDAFTSDDAAFLRTISSNMEYCADDYRRTKRDQAMWVDRQWPEVTRQSAQGIIDDAHRRLEMELTSVKNAMREYLQRTSDPDNDRDKLSKWESRLTELRSLSGNQGAILVHYEDKPLGAIAPKMTRYYEFAGEGKPEWNARAVILDHVVEGAEHDRSITTSFAPDRN